MNRIVYSLISCAFLASGAFSNVSQAALVHAFWSFNVNPDATGGFTQVVTAETFPGIPSVTRTGSALVTTGGEASFTDFQGTTWTGSGSTGGSGSLAWNPSSTGNSFTLNIDMAGLENLTLRLGLRAAASNDGVALTQFSGIDYNIGSGFVTAASGADLNFPGPVNNSFKTYLLDLSGLSAIENQSNVAIRFSFANIVTDTSLRIDNIQLTAEVIPEPSTWAFAAFGLLLLRRKCARII